MPIFLLGVVIIAVSKVMIIPISVSPGVGISLLEFPLARYWDGARSWWHLNSDCNLSCLNIILYDSESCLNSVGKVCFSGQLTWVGTCSKSLTSLHGLWSNSVPKPLKCDMHLFLSGLSISQRGTWGLVYPGDSVLVSVRAYMLGSGEPSSSSEMSI